MAEIAELVDELLIANGLKMSRRDQIIAGLKWWRDIAPTRADRGELRKRFPKQFRRWNRRAKALAAELDAMNHPQESDMNRNQRAAALSAAVSVQPPAADWNLIACKRFQSASLIYDAGCAVSVDALGPNFAALMAGGFVRWMPPTVQARSKPRPQMVSDEKPRAAVEAIVHNTPGGDPVADWKRSLSETAALCAGDHARASDLLVMDRGGADLYRRFVQVSAERNARERNEPGRRIPPT